MSNPVKQIFRFIIFILLQAVVLTNVPPLHRFVTPYLYFLFLLWLPFNTNRSFLLIVGFITGFALDLFLQTPGLHASACVLVAYLRPFMVTLLVPRETKELGFGSPSVRTMGFAPYALFVTVLTLFHTILLVLLEWMQFPSLTYFLGKILFTTLTSLVLITVTELLFNKRGKVNRSF
jgi:rod shape-determining protein MreD